MEKLKPLNEIFQPDVRQTYFCRIMRTGEKREMTFEDHYSDVELIKLNDNVPEDIRDRFETARNLLVYSWFVYPFGVVAEFHALATVEAALKIKAGVEEGSFKKLLE